MPFFFFVGTLGLMRLPDPLSRLQVLSKAGTLALGLVVLGLLPQVGTIAAGLKLVFIWLLVLVSAASVSPRRTRGRASPMSMRTLVNDVSC